MSLAAVAVFLAVSIKTVRRIVARGDLPGHLLGRLLEDVIVAINDMSDIPLRRRQDLASGCKTVARALGLPTSQIKANPVWLKDQLKLLPRTPTGMTNGHWRNARSRLGSALAVAGAVSMSKRSREPIAPMCPKEDFGAQVPEEVSVDRKTHRCANSAEDLRGQVCRRLGASVTCREQEAGGVLR